MITSMISFLSVNVVLFKISLLVNINILEICFVNISSYYKRLIESVWTPERDAYGFPYTISVIDKHLLMLNKKTRNQNKLGT